MSKSREKHKDQEKLSERKEEDKINTQKQGQKGI
jgi:hypothetical protein